MRRLSLHRWRNRIAWVLILSLLWSQFAVAMHAVNCDPQPSSGAGSINCHSVHVEELGDSQLGHAAHDSACAEHCGTNYSADIARVVMPAVILAIHPVFDIAQQPTVESKHQLWHRSDSVPWHGPTGHPAAILLI